MYFNGYVTSKQAQLLRRKQIDLEIADRLKADQENFIKSLRILQKSLSKLQRTAKKSVIPIEIERRHRISKEIVVGGWIIGDFYTNIFNTAALLEAHVTIVLSETGSILSGVLVNRLGTDILVVRKSQRLRKPINKLRSLRYPSGPLFGMGDAGASHIMRNPQEIQHIINSYLKKDMARG
jgi:hypothetical protein